jgi:hypothetical protein
MTKAELLSQLSAKYLVVRAPEIVQAATDGIATYRISFFETGKTPKEKPSGLWNSVQFYVFREGQGDEAAYYMRDAEQPEAQNTLVSTGTLADVNRVYFSPVMRATIRGAMLTAAQAVRWEAEATPNHAKRAQLAAAMIQDTESYIGMFAAFVALDNAIQAAGGAVTDAQVQNVVIANFEWAAIILVA